MVVIPRGRQMEWLDHLCPETNILQALPAHSFKVELWDDDGVSHQAELAL
jgi:translation initiation factor IF-1